MNIHAPIPTTTQSDVSYTAWELDNVLTDLEAASSDQIRTESAYLVELFARLQRIMETKVYG